MRFSETGSTWMRQRSIYRAGSPLGQVRQAEAGREVAQWKRGPAGGMADMGNLKSPAPGASGFEIRVGHELASICSQLMLVMSCYGLHRLLWLKTPPFVWQRHSTSPEREDSWTHAEGHRALKAALVSGQQAFWGGVTRLGAYTKRSGSSSSGLLGLWREPSHRAEVRRDGESTPRRHWESRHHREGARSGCP